MKDRGLPKFIVIGSDDHPLGKRSIWLYEDGSAEGLSQAYGMTSNFEFGVGEGPDGIEKIKTAYADHDANSTF